MKKQHHEEHVDETWLIPYADMLTLLLALFIVMFAMSKVDSEKFQQISEQFHVIFMGGSGMLSEEGASVLPLNKTGTGSEAEQAETGQGISNGQLEDTTMNEILQELETAIAEEGFSDQVKVVLNKEGLEISIQDLLLFHSGQAEVLDGVQPLLMHISEMIRALDNPIKVVGHTDNIPVKSGIYRSNWDLSAFRAINVMNFMIENGKVDSKKLSIQAYGEYMPKYDNNTAEGRAKNRRVEIFIIRNYPLDSEKTSSADGIAAETDTGDSTAKAE